MKLRTAACILTAALSAACANAGDRRDTDWQQARARMEEEREAGRVQAAQAYRLLWQQYREIYGSDAGIAPYFAYAGSLMHSAELGDIDVQEARLLVAAKEQEALQQAYVLRERRERYAYPEN
jgi:hypothetical protein